MNSYNNDQIYNGKIEGYDTKNGSIFFKHKLELENFTKIQQVDRTKRILLLKSFFKNEELDETSIKVLKKFNLFNLYNLFLFPI